jgi:hypothetical protein
MTVTTEKATPAKKKPAAKKKPPAKKSERYEDKPDPKFKYKVSEDGSATATPLIGEVNVIELQQEERTDWLFTRLEKEEALRYTSGRVKTKYDETKGDLCVIVTKYRGEAIDANNPKRAGECYTLLFTPFYAEKNADLQDVDEGISDDDIAEAMIALDESKALYYRNKWLVEKEMRGKERDYWEDKDYDFRKSVTKTATKVVDDTDLADDKVRRDIALFDMNKVTRWIVLNKFWLIGFIAIVFIIASMFSGGG